MIERGGEGGAGRRGIVSKEQSRRGNSIRRTISQESRIEHQTRFSRGVHTASCPVSWASIGRKLYIDVIFESNRLGSVDVRAIM
jgi:hypothetical protein